jgi:hypothetical protein
MLDRRAPLPEGMRKVSRYSLLEFSARVEL